MSRQLLTANCNKDEDGRFPKHDPSEQKVRVGMAAKEEVKVVVVVSGIAAEREESEGARFDFRLTDGAFHRTPTGE